MLIKSRYKVTYVCYAEENYAALIATDVESRDKDEYLLNVYEGELIKRYIGIYDRLRHCPEYCYMFMYEDALIGVFKSHQGKSIDEVFYKGAVHEDSVRLAFAHSLFHMALTISDFPPELGCAALLSDNLRVMYNERRIAVNYAARPLAQMNAREMAFLTIDQVKKVLLRRYASPAAEIKFLDALENQVFLTPVALYSFWMQSRGEIKADYEKLAAKAGLSRMLYLFFQNLLRFGRRLTRKKR